MTRKRSRIMRVSEDFYEEVHKLKDLQEQETLTDTTDDLAKRLKKMRMGF